MIGLSIITYDNLKIFNAISNYVLTPYWSDRLNKSVLMARQLSGRIGELTRELASDRVKISGSAVTYMIGSIEVWETQLF